MGILFIRHVFSSNSLQFNTIIGDHYSAHLMLAIMFIRKDDEASYKGTAPLWRRMKKKRSGRYNTIAIFNRKDHLMSSVQRNAFIAMFHYFVNLKNAFYCYFIHLHRISEFSIPKLPWPRKVNIWTYISFHDDFYVFVCAILNLDSGIFSYGWNNILYVSRMKYTQQKNFNFEIWLDIQCLFK